MRKNSEKCLICGKTGFKNSNSFTKHLRIHKISSEQYYLFYIDYTAGICEVCNKEVKFSSIDKGFPKLCRTCNNRNNPDRIKKIKETNLKRYASENVSQVEEFKEKRKETNLRRYGVEYAMSNPEIMSRCLETWKENYEGGHPGRDPKIKEKKKKTCQKRYGVDNPSSVEEFKEKRKRTNLEKFGTEYVMKNSEIQKKSEEAIFKKYGVRHILESEEFLEKVRKTNQKNRGVDWPMQSPGVVEKVSGSNSYRWVEDREQRFAHYTEKFCDQNFRDQIRKEQKNIDPITDEQLKEDANLHHINYDKTDDSRINLIFLNKPIHSKTNTNREHWNKILLTINKEIIQASQYDPPEL